MPLSVPDAELVISLRAHEGPNAIVYFGGNGEDVAYNLPEFSSAFPEHALYLMNYRGYGGSSGTPTERPSIKTLKPCSTGCMHSTRMS